MAGGTAPRSGAVRTRAGAQRLPGSPAGDHRPDRAHGARRRQPRQAPAHPHRGRPDAAHPFQDGGQLAHLPAGAALAGAEPSGTRGAGESGSACASASGSPSSSCSRRPARPTSSATSVPTCWATTGVRTPSSRRCSGSRRRRTGRSAPRCSTSATWPGSATCGAARCSSCAASTRTAGSPRSNDLPRLIELSHRMLLANRDRAGQTATGRSAPRRVQLRLRPQGAAVPALPHADPTRAPRRPRLRAGDLLVSRAASPPEPSGPRNAGSGQAGGCRLLPWVVRDARS